MYTLPGGPEADRFLHERVARRSVKLHAVSGIVRRVLQGIAAAWGDEYNLFLARFAVDDVPMLFSDLRRSELLSMESEERPLRAAFLTFVEHHIPLDDALVATLAQNTGHPA